MSESIPGIMYAPETADHYGINLQGDLQRWNWRWMMHGDKPDIFVDNALLVHFNEVQRLVMTWIPERAIEWATTTLPNRVTPQIVARMQEAQQRLFPPVITYRSENVVAVNFRAARK